MLTPAEKAHAESVLEPATIVPIPPLQRPRLLVGSVIRKPKVVLDALFKSLLWQRARDPGWDVDYAFINNFAASDAYAAEAMQAYEAFPVGTHINVSSAPAPEGDYHETTGVTRGWTPPAWHRVGALKNTLIQRALDGHYDYLWLIDADVLTDPWTLQSLLDCQAPVVSAVYWTRWTKPQKGSALIQHAGPQVWVRHPYELSGRGWTEADFRAALVNRQRVRVWGLGACTLLARPALEKGLNFSKFAELPPGAMSDGEDRHFCMRAEQLHIPLYADAWPDVWHAYHPSEYGDIDQRMAELESRQALRFAAPKLGWNISATLENLEIPGLPPLHVRGRLGQVKLLPELEEKLYELHPGEAATLKCHFPAHWPHDGVRGRDFVMRVRLLDCKPFRLPPTIDEETAVGRRSGAVIDHTNMTADQLRDMMTEVA